jgi:hypothetical protein
MSNWYKKFEENRPKWLYWIWMFMMLLNLFSALGLAYAANKFDIAVSFELWWCIIFAIFSYLNVRLWQYYINNPDKYEALLDARKKKDEIKRISRGANRTSARKHGKKRDGETDSTD